MIRKITYGGILIAIGLLLPQAFHIFGANAGMTFLPMEIPILLAGALLGPVYGGTIGVIIPLLSSLVTGMPAVPKVYFMITGYMTYGVVGGILIRKYNIYISLICSMFFGRIINGIALLFGFYLLHIQAPFMTVPAYLTGLIMGIPGVMIQLIFIPYFYKRLKAGGFTLDV